MFNKQPKYFKRYFFKEVHLWPDKLTLQPAPYTFIE
jgi:hypothetical protein